MNRHDLIYLQTTDEFQFLDKSLSQEVKSKVQDMILHNIPFTVCRQESEDYFKVAINCMVQGQKHRVALGLSTTPTLSHKPLLLSTILDFFNDQTSTELKSFIRRIAMLSCSVHVYGSYANQFLTKESFVRSQSDLDLLIQLENISCLNQLLEEIIQIKQRISINIDGEINITETQNISFNELIFALQHQQEQVIVKELRHISLQNIADIGGGQLDVLQQQHHYPA